MRLSLTRLRGSGRDVRAGVAATELAACLPVIVLLVLAMIECCTMIFLKQSLTVAAYEGARKSVEQNATDADVLATSNDILSDRRVKDGSIAISPANIRRVPPGNFIEVTVSRLQDRIRPFREVSFAAGNSRGVPR